MKSNYKFCVASVVPDYEGVREHKVVYYAYKAGYGVHSVDDINDDYVVWYDTEQEALKQRLKSSDCVVSKLFEQKVR